MKKLFVSYEIAVMLKEKGFDEPCFAVYNKLSNGKVDFLPKKYGINKMQTLISVPLYQQVIDWFREKHNIRIVDSLHTNTMTSMDLNKHFHFNAIRIEGGGSYTKDLKWGNGDSEYQHYTDYYKALELTIHELILKKI